jgi:hypothetical protein
VDYSILGIIILVVDIIALLDVWASGASTGEKGWWTLVILLLPVFGLIAWYLAGPKRDRLQP